MGGQPEGQRAADRGVGADPAVPLDDLVHAAPRHPEPPCDLGLRQVERPQVVPLEEAARFGKYLITGAAVTGAAALLLFVHQRSKAPMRERPEDLGPVIEVDAVEVP